MKTALRKWGMGSPERARQFSAWLNRKGYATTNQGLWVIGVVTEWENLREQWDVSSRLPAEKESAEHEIWINSFNYGMVERKRVRVVKGDIEDARKWANEYIHNREISGELIAHGYLGAIDVDTGELLAITIE